MNETFLKLYYQMPPSMRSLVASLRGLYLRSWRYGPETERLVEEALGRDSWSPKQWRAWQEERLAYVLHRAATQVPYYREQWAARRRRGDLASWDYLENWPILGKESVRENPAAFVADDCDQRRMWHEHTSGTTGTPMNLWWSRKTVREWYALCEARYRHWYGVSRHNRVLMLGGQLVTPVIQQRPPFWVWNKAMNQLYMSSYHMKHDLFRYYLKAIAHYSPTYLMGYPSSLSALAQFFLESGRQNLEMTVAITNAEPVYDYQRTAIAQAFKCPVRETYGMAEIVVAASECAAERLHLWPEVGWVEIMEKDHLLPDGACGDFVCTSLLNADMPLIRYGVGDRGALSGEPESCNCGRKLPVISRIEGRTNDVLIAPDGRRIYWLNPVFYGLPVREAQIIQERLNRLRVRYVPAPELTRETERAIIERLKGRMGGVEVIMEPVDAVPRGPNGKFRAVISELSGESGIS
jgi:phenylacetate-CoA ligase